MVVNNPEFNASGSAYFPYWKKKFSNRCAILEESTWKIKINKPERDFIRFNYDKLLQTVEFPQEVRRSQKNKNSFIFYREYDKITIVENVTAPSIVKYMAVVIKDKPEPESPYIQTFYFTDRKKRGEIIWKE